MSAVVFEDTSVELQEGESVLEGLLRQGFDIPNGCRAGACQSCMMVAAEGKIPEQASKGLSPAQSKLNYFLSCQCHPEEALKVSRCSEALGTIKGKVIEKEFLNDAVLRLRLSADLDYLPGQYVTLWKDDNLARSYSLASHNSEEAFLEFHIKCVTDGAFSGWVANEVSVGDEIGIQGPLGTCVYTASSDQPLLLAGIGTGLAPLYGILKDAMQSGHTGAIDLVVAGKSDSSFYLVDELQAIAAEYSNVTLHWLAQELETSNSVFHEADVYQYVSQKFADMKGYKVFLCGAESFVKKLRKKCFLAGAGMSDIAADVFLAAS